jgi:hypothetical protein
MTAASCAVITSLGLSPPVRPTATAWRTRAPARPAGIEGLRPRESTYRAAGGPAARYRTGGEPGLLGLQVLHVDQHRLPLRHQLIDLTSLRHVLRDRVRQAQRDRAYHDSQDRSPAGRPGGAGERRAVTSSVAGPCRPPALICTNQGRRPAGRASSGGKNAGRPAS